jgi:FtsZ-binding cell division protein ZapB
MKMENKSKSVSYLTALLLVLSVALVIILYLFFSQKKENELTISQLEEYKTIITEKKDSLEHQLQSIVVKYDSLMTDNDTLNLQLKEQQDKIRRLLSLRINDSQKIKKYEKELGTIRDVLKSYIVQIDSLNTKNLKLMAENKELQHRTVQVETKNKKLEEEKVELVSIKDVAKTLVASNIVPVPLNKRSKEYQKSKGVEKIRIDFILRKNAISDPGPKTIFVSIIRPDGIVLSSPEPEIILVQKEEVAVSAHREVNYENIDLPVSIYWDNDGNLIPGNYTVKLFAESKLIGESEFSLK